MDRPCTPTEFRMSIGCVNYNRDMWPSRAHIFKHLTEKSGLKKKYILEWTDKMQKASHKMRLLMEVDALAACPNHKKRFNIYTDASYFLLGSCIMQYG